MIKLKLLPFLAVTLLTGNVHALSGHGFEILSEKIETSPGAVGSLHPGSLPRQGMAMAWAMAYDADGHAGENVQISGAHTMDIKNDTASDQYYTYTYELSCDGQYFRKIDNLVLHPHGRIDDGGISNLSTFHTVPGTYKIFAVTKISGESSHQYVDSGVLRLV